MDLERTDLDAVDGFFAKALAEGRSPGSVHAVVRDGEVLHVRGTGTGVLGAEVPPSATSVLRIASMTKSFTAAAVLLLRDRGRLRLDDLVVDRVPGAPGGITVRHLLTMSGGLLTDDPWGDRQESQTPGELDEVLVAGIARGAEPGVGFEYSNLGFALLGRVVDAVLGGDGAFRAFVLEELAGPLGMSATTYDARGVGPALVPGHVDHGEGWALVPQVEPGTFSAMGGLHSSVADLARWVGGFTDAFRRPDAPHPLSAASRREMQQQHRFVGVSGALELEVPAGGAALTATATGYGMGLFVEEHTDHGTVVQHSGGYPGYGSHMRWHPETGLGVVVLTNGTYAGPVGAARDALRALVAPRRAPATSPVATPALVEAVSARLVADAPLTADDGLFTANLWLDVPEPVRHRRLSEARDLVGPVSGPTTAPYVTGLGTVSWSLPAERGRLDVEVKVAPTLPQPAVQALVVTAVPEPSSALREAAERTLAAAEVVRTLGGEPQLAGVLAGDGDRGATYAVRAGTTWWRLVLAADADPVLTASPTSSYARLEHRFGAG